MSRIFENQEKFQGVSPLPDGQPAHENKWEEAGEEEEEEEEKKEEEEQN